MLRSGDFIGPGPWCCYKLPSIDQRVLVNMEQESEPHPQRELEDGSQGQPLLVTESNESEAPNREGRTSDNENAIRAFLQDPNILSKLQSLVKDNPSAAITDPFCSCFAGINLNKGKGFPLLYVKNGDSSRKLETDSSGNLGDFLFAHQMLIRSLILIQTYIGKSIKIASKFGSSKLIQHLIRF